MKDEINTDNYHLYWEEVLFNDKEDKRQKIPLLRLDLKGAIKIKTIIDVMKDVKVFTAEMKKKYVAIADYRNVDINATLKNLILIGMESPLNNMVKMKNAAIVTFVLIDKSDGSSEFIEKALSSINKPPEARKANYSYIFISSPDQIYDHLPNIFSK